MVEDGTLHPVFVVGRASAIRNALLRGGASRGRGGNMAATSLCYLFAFEHCTGSIGKPAGNCGGLVNI